MASKEELEAMGITTEKCTICKKVISTDEYIENGGYCKECMDKEEGIEDFEGVEKPIYEIDGNMGTTLKVYENRCVISTTSGGKAFLFGGLMKATRGDKEFYYSDITSLQFKNLKGTTGYIQFEYPGSHSGNNFTSENSFTFSATLGTNKYYQLQETMPPVYDYIQAKIREYKTNRNTVESVISQADEIKKFKELLDNGIITQEEFEAKKKQLLGL